MLIQTSRIEHTNKGIKFYEQDILYDDYIYTGDLEAELTIDYNNTGFGIAIVNSEGSSLYNKDELLLFKLGNKNIEVIYKNNDSQSTVANYSCPAAKTCSENLKMKIKKSGNKIVIIVNNKHSYSFTAKTDIESFNIAYYSNKDNIIKNIDISAAIPYSWIVNMENTNGGYIEFYRDGFEITECTGKAEVGQINIFLRRGEYFLKYKKENNTDIKAFVFESENSSIIDEEKNILKKDGSFFVESGKYITIKFVGTIGKISRISITTLKDNEYVRTSPDTGDFIVSDGSYIRFLIDKLKEFSFKGIINYVPGLDHTSPISYQVISDTSKNYGIYDLDIAIGVEYEYKYSKNKLSIYKNGRVIKSININGEFINVFKNINAIIKDLHVIDLNGNDDNIIVENTIKKTVPGSIKSPIIVLGEDGNPLELSSSFRYYYKNNTKKYIFTNKEREYFNPKNLIKLNSVPSSKSGSIIAYGIRKESSLDMSRILEIEKEGKDTIDACANIYDIYFEEDLKYIDKQNKEIRFSDVSDYKLIIVDYLKEDSYSINYRYNFNSYEVDISTRFKTVDVLYDNTEKDVGDIEYINEKLYLDTKMIPTHDCYVVLGR